MKNPFVIRCPNCESAWTGGHPSPETITGCVVCNNKRGKMTGWVWSKLIDPFCYIGRSIVHRNINLLKEEV